MNQKLKRIFFPKRCTLCGNIIPIEQDYCGCCGKGYSLVSNEFCPHCGADTENCNCGKTGSVYLDHVTAPFYYTGYAKQRLIEFKFRGQKAEGAFLGEKMSLRFAEVFSGAKADFVTFVPMTQSEMMQRGYNQSEILARYVARQLLLPARGVLLKTAESERQHTLSQSQRIENLKGVFEVLRENSIAGKTIILCDDIKTTGTTLSRCAETLKAVGAAEVYCLCAAISDYVTL